MTSRPHFPRSFGVTSVCNASAVLIVTGAKSQVTSVASLRTRPVCLPLKTTFGLCHPLICDFVSVPAPFPVFSASWKVFTIRDRQIPAPALISSDPSKTRKKCLLTQIQERTISAVAECSCLCFSPVCSTGKQPGQCFPGTNYTKFSEASGDLIPTDFTGCLNLFVSVGLSI